MKKYRVELHADYSKSFRAIRAANSLDIDPEKKSAHIFEVSADLEGAYNVGLIVGASGSGKTTLAKSIFGDGCFRTYLDPAKAVIDQFPGIMTYDDCAARLNGVGLTAVPCWIKPSGTLSNGQKARAEAALALASSDPTIVLDEWTSVVDRTVAKVMSHCVQKHARRTNRRVVLVACHYDIVEWLDPDWIIDCNSQTFIDRRGLRRERTEKLQFEIREVTRSTWASFSKYHYLSEKVPGGQNYFYGLFQGKNQIGFQCFSNYIPIRPGSVPIYHSNRTVVHPDYAGMGLGLKMINACCELMMERFKNRLVLRATFSSEPLYRARLKDKEHWKLLLVKRKIGRHPPPGASMDRKGGFRENVKLYTFEWNSSDRQAPDASPSSL